MFHLSCVLKSYDAHIATTPGKSELVRNGEIVYTTPDDTQHTIFQAVDKHFCVKYKFLTRTNIMLLGNKRQIVEDLLSEGGNTVNQFQTVHKKSEDKIDVLLAQPAPSVDISTLIEMGENKKNVKKFSAIKFPTAQDAARYYYTKSGSILPEEAELKGNKIMLAQPGNAQVHGFIEAISTIFKAQGDANKIAPKKKTRTVEYSAAALAALNTIPAATEMLTRNWLTNNCEPDYCDMLEQGATKDIIGQNACQAIWRELPKNATIEQHMAIILDSLDNNAGHINCDKKEFRFGPFGAATFLLARKSQLELRDGNLIKKESK